MRHRLGVGVLGCSSFARRRMLPALRAHPDTTVTAVASRDPDLAARTATEFGCRPLGYEELLASPDVDAVYLPLPPALHAPWAGRALRAGKHVLVEKPAATSAVEARELDALARQRGLTLWENVLFPHHSQHREVLRLLADGRLGELRAIRANFCIPPRDASDIRYAAEVGGGALLDLAVYPLRAAQLLTGDPLRLTGAVLRVDGARGVDLSGQALLLSGSGVPVHVEFGFEHSYDASYTLWGSRGRLCAERAFTPPADFRPRLRLDGPDGSEYRTLPEDDQTASVLSAFVAAVAGVRRRTAFGTNAGAPDWLRTAELVDEIRATAATVDVSEVAGCR